MRTFLGIDVGTSGAKAVLIDETGAVLRRASHPYAPSSPKPLWSEQDPEDWFQGVLDCLMQVGETRPAAIGLTGQMHGAVFLDGNGDVIRHAILWNDQRTVEECAEIERIVGAETVREITRNPPLTGFQIPKLLWLRRHEPMNFARIRAVLLPKDYLRLRLSGSMATDVSDASGTGAFDVPERAWSNRILGDLDLESAWFPKAFESDDVTGYSRGAPGLEDGIPIVAGAGDQAAGGVGTGAVVGGVVCISLGTSGVVFSGLDEPKFDQKGSVHTFCHANRAWHAMSVMLSCGGAVQWFRDRFAPEASVDELARRAAKIAPGANGAMFLPYLSGERSPHNDPLCRAAFVGLTPSHGLDELARAVFEGVSFGLADGWRALRELGASANDFRVTGGGSRSEFWVQLLADIFRAPVATLENDEGPAFGAALLAGVGSGSWNSTLDACSATVKAARLVEPSGTDYGGAIERFRALYPGVANA